MLQCSIFCSQPKFIFLKKKKKRGINIENNTIQYNTIQYNTIQYNTIYFIPIKVPQGAITTAYAHVFFSRVTKYVKK
jgi:hypothetical protein